MMSQRSRLFCSTVALTAALLASSQASASTTDSFCSFPSALTTWTYNQNAFEDDNSIIDLTDAVANEIGTAWFDTPIPLAAGAPFHAHFVFEMGPSATGGEGIAFVMQNSAAGPNAVGTGPAGMGYATITPSVIVAFDTVKNSGPSANNVGILLNGSDTTYTATGIPGFTMAGAGMLYGWVDYNGAGTLTASVSATATKPAAATVSATVNLVTQLGAQMYVGFTAATGAGAVVNAQDVYELELSTAGVPCACEGDSACTGATPACSTSGICAICSATNHTACTGATPVCDVATSSCVGCLTNANCASPTPICGTPALTCRACASAADCGGSTPECATTGANAGDCVACVADANCPPATPRCTPTNTCVQCLSGADCGGDTPICDNGSCVACSSDSQCSGATPACEVWGACGQCSSTNATACTGGTAVCDFPTGTCVGCEFNSSCSGMTPTCNTTTHTCRACADNADCMGNPGGPACVTGDAGMKAGSCVICTANSDCTSMAASICDTIANECVQCEKNTDCTSTPATPVCNTQNLCVGCVQDSDCSGATPICNPASSTCVACANDYSASNPGELSCPSAALPACQPAGTPLAGQCALCSATNQSSCVTLPTTPVCIAASAACGCILDSDCPTGDYCDTSTTATGVCTAGCRTTDGGATNCPTGEYCTVTDGSIGTCMSQPCNSNTDCKAPTSVCDTIVQPHVCVACLNASDCPTGNVCNTNNTCAQCTPMQTLYCTPGGTGAACLASGMCGCATDADCGTAVSGRICNAATNTCQAGCRGMGGNACPPPETCSVTTMAIGTCSGATTTVDAAPPPKDSGVDAHVAHDAGVDSGDHVVTDSPGCGCRVAPPSGTSETRLLLGAALLGLVARRRRRSGRRSAARRVR